ncbi:MAG: hypothetical protein WBG57_07960 [Ornithinimicrobium sp.]
MPQPLSLEPGYRALDPFTPWAQRPRSLHRQLSARPAHNLGRRWWAVARAVLAPDDRAAQLTEAITRVAAPVASGRRIVVVGAHGGAGATTLALSLASLAATYRKDPVALVDDSDAHGGLLTRLTAAPEMSVGTADRHLAGGSRRREASTWRRPGLHVFSPATPHGGMRALDEIQRRAAVTFVDTDRAHSTTGNPSAAGEYSRSNATVIAGENTVRGAAAVRACLTGLRHVGIGGDSTLVVFMERVAGSGTTRNSLAREVPSASAGDVFFVPYDRHLAGAAQIRLELLAPSTSIALTCVASVVIEASAVMSNSNSGENGADNTRGGHDTTGVKPR